MRESIQNSVEYEEKYGIKKEINLYILMVLKLNK